jgi:hypothetical protein
MLEVFLALWAAGGIAGHAMFCARFKAMAGDLPDGWAVMWLFAAVIGPLLLVEEIFKRKS